MVTTMGETMTPGDLWQHEQERARRALVDALDAYDQRMAGVAADREADARYDRLGKDLNDALKEATRDGDEEEVRLLVDAHLNPLRRQIEALMSRALTAELAASERERELADAKAIVAQLQAQLGGRAA